MNESLKKSFGEHINKYLVLQDSELTKLFSIFNLKKIVKGSELIAPGSEETRIFLIISGLVRYYYLSEDGREWNKAFIPEGTLTVSFSRSFLSTFSPYAIDALEETTLMIADYSAFELLYSKYPMIERLGRKLMESILISKMKREQSFLQDNAKYRYLDFVKEHPALSGRIPQYHIASYLGITEASLSRILRELH